jgi:hypothetical protein
MLATLHLEKKESNEKEAIILEELKTDFYPRKDFGMSLQQFNAS